MSSKFISLKNIFPSESNTERCLSILNYKHLHWKTAHYPFSYKEFPLQSPPLAYLKKFSQGFPGGAVVEKLPADAGGHGLEPWSGKIPHAAEQLGPWATITEPAHLEPVLHNKRGRDSERPVHRDEEWPPLAATRESPCTETKTQHSHK